MDPAEVEFLAEKETVKIIPNFSLDKVYLIGVRRAFVFACREETLDNCDGLRCVSVAGAAGAAAAALAGLGLLLCFVFNK